ncbi:MAG: hypothetical protein D6780_04845 [Candidatus Dadabacteria bacterium]|nr:MAG: hypothetical protein D6780_04845 [Candidatus Dadabacteria bacterium]
MFKAGINFLKSEKPLLSIVPDLNDTLTFAYFESAKKIQHPVFKVCWDKARKSATLLDERGGKVLKSDLYIDAVFELRNKVNSWPIEVIKHLEDILKFLGIKQESKALKPFNNEQRVVF